MSDKIEKPEGGLVRQFDPRIQTTANPSAENLRDARRLLNIGAIRKFVEESVAQNVSEDAIVDGVSIRIAEAWGDGQVQAAYECARYLFDEFKQLGDGLYVVSSDTGRVVSTVTEDDFYQPAPVPRENGELVLPLKQLRPEVAAQLHSWVFERGREQRLLETIAIRANQTPFLRAEGDPRLLTVTQAGREHIVQEFNKLDPQVLFRAVGGTSGAFLRRFEMTDQTPRETEGLVEFKITLASKSTMGIQDPLTFNLHHNRPQAMQAALTQGWVREIARRLSLEAAQSEPISEKRLSRAHLEGAPLWIAPPEAHQALRRANPQVLILPVVGARVLGVRDAAAGTIVVPPVFGASHREWFDRWEVDAEIELCVWVNWAAFLPLDITDLAHEALVVK